MQGDHEELEILLQKCLISSCFNEKISLRKREHRYIEILSRKIHAVRFIEESLDGHDDAKSAGNDPTMQIPLLDFVRSIFIDVSLSSHVSFRDSPSA